MNLKIGVAVAALALAACGGDETKNSVTNNVTANNTTANNTTPNNTSNNTTPNNTTVNNTTANNTTVNNTTEPLKDPPTCADTPAPPRCSENPDDHVWGPASVVDFFLVEGTDTDPVCCYDYTGDGEIDNSLGFNLAGFGFLADINSSVATSIASGSLVLALEHEGLTDLANDDAFIMNFYIAEHDVADFATTGFQADSNPVLIDPASLDQGSQPQAYLPSASATAGDIVAGPGAVKIEITLFDSPLQLTISQARSDAKIAAGSTLGAEGVALSSGQLGGVVKIRDIFVAVNEFSAGACECLGLGAEQLVNPDTGTCAEGRMTQACTDAGEDTCAEVAGACNLFGAVGLFADVDLDGDGLFESVSIGAAYTAVGATINGVAP